MLRGKGVGTAVAAGPKRSGRRDGGKKTKGAMKMAGSEVAKARGQRMAKVRLALGAREAVALAAFSMC